MNAFSTICAIDLASSDGRRGCNLHQRNGHHEFLDKETPLSSPRECLCTSGSVSELCKGNHRDGNFFFWKMLADLGDSFFGCYSFALCFNKYCRVDQQAHRSVPFRCIEWLTVKGDCFLNILRKILSHPGGWTVRQKSQYFFDPPPGWDWRA